MLSPEQQEVLKKQADITLLQKREERYMYYGIYEQYCLNKHNMLNLEYSKLNPSQHLMFKRILHGLKMYSKNEIATMHKEKRGRIIKVWKKSQKVINQWKQQISNKKLNCLLEVTFGKNSSIINDLMAIPTTDILDDYTNMSTLKDLGITYEDLILRFMSVGLLPKNFLSLK
jgi:hypothetical protein